MFTLLLLVLILTLLFIGFVGSLLEGRIHFVLIQLDVSLIPGVWTFIFWL